MYSGIGNLNFVQHAFAVKTFCLLFSFPIPMLDLSVKIGLNSTGSYAIKKKFHNESKKIGRISLKISQQNDAVSPEIMRRKFENRMETFKNTDNPLESGSTKIGEPISEVEMDVSQGIKVESRISSSEAEADPILNLNTNPQCNQTILITFKLHI